MPNCKTAKAVLMAWVTMSLSQWAFPSAIGADHQRAAGEPYRLAGNRLVFTTWIHVRPGEFDWRDKENRSVFASKTHKLGPDEARFRAIDIPWGIRLVAEPARRLDPIITGGQRPWEANGVWVNTLMHDGGKYRLWGIGQDDKGGRSATEEGNRYACYFESKDGITWERPSVGQLEFDGSRDNNLIRLSPHATVFRDPVASPEERYKAVWVGEYDRQRFEEVKDRRAWSKAAIHPAGRHVYAILAAVSPDGLAWTDLPEPISFEVSDTHNICYYDHSLGKYVLYTRTREVLPTADGFSAPATERSSNLGRRAIGRTESSNFREFPPSQTIIGPAADMAPSDTWYTNGYSTIPGAPDHHLLFPTIWHQATDATSMTLFSSYDGRLWSRLPGPPVLETATFGEWDGGSVFNAPGLVELPDGSWAMPYTGYIYPHKYPRGAWKYAIGLAVWPKGRLIALAADARGEFATAAVIAPGRALKINAVTQRAGSILVEAADLDGKPIPGRSFAESIPVVGDHFWTPIRWKQHDDLGVNAGQPVELRFRMDRARIYGLEFQTAAQEP